MSTGQQDDAPWYMKYGARGLGTAGGLSEWSNSYSYGNMQIYVWTTRYKIVWWNESPYFFTMCD